MLRRRSARRDLSGPRAHLRLAMLEITGPSDMRSWSRDARVSGRTIALVPTMGYLHEGHLRLVDHAVRAADVVVMSIFVNPIQFGPGEDYATYPRDVDRDRRLAEERGVDCVFVPDVTALYPSDPEILLSPGKMADSLCGPRRPGHFEGVLTVVAKLFNIVEPDVAVFGRKDAQQAMLIRRMAHDLNFPVDVAVAPTVREHDGLAMSSRNAYLKPGERRAAPILSRALEAAHQRFVDGCRNPKLLLARLNEVLTTEPQVELEYAEIVDSETLSTVHSASQDSILAVAARLGNARLIDNIVIGEGLSGDEKVNV